MLSPSRGVPHQRGLRPAHRQACARVPRIGASSSQEDLVLLRARHGMDEHLAVVRHRGAHPLVHVAPRRPVDARLVAGEGLQKLVRLVGVRDLGAPRGGGGRGGGEVL
eukprot:8947524-Pyramimonas_sp.AAC.3